MDRACYPVGRCAQMPGQRRLGEHLRDRCAHEVRAEQALVGVEEQLDEAVAVAGRRRLARSGEGEASDLVFDAALAPSCSVMPTDATSGCVKTHEGTVV